MAAEEANKVVNVEDLAAVNEAGAMKTSDLEVMGILQEANRQFFHMRGLFLVSAVNERGEERLEVYAGKQNVGFVCNEVSPQKVAMVKALADGVKEDRKAHYGFITQPAK